MSITKYGIDEKRTNISTWSTFEPQNKNKTQKNASDGSYSSILNQGAVVWCKLEIYAENATRFKTYGLNVLIQLSPPRPRMYERMWERG